MTSNLISHHNVKLSIKGTETKAKKDKTWVVFYNLKNLSSTNFILQINANMQNLFNTGRICSFYKHREKRYLQCFGFDDFIKTFKKKITNISPCNHTTFLPSTLGRSQREAEWW